VDPVPLLRFSCPHPIECGQTKHWSIPSWRACQDLDDTAIVREYEADERRREDAEWEQVYAAAAQQHDPEEPATPAGRALRDNGERQLRRLDPSHLLTLGHLTSSGTARVNRALRSTGTGALSESCAADLDWAGYESNAAVVAAAEQLYAELGAAVELDNPLTAYRGVLVPPHTPLSMLLDQPTPRQVFIDPGFVFAATSEEDAAFFKSPDAWWSESARDPAARPLLLVLEIRRAICIPDPRHRSRALVSHLARTRRAGPDQFAGARRQSPTAIERAMGQVVVAPGSRWEVLGSGPRPGSVSLRQM